MRQFNSYYKYSLDRLRKATLRPQACTPRSSPNQRRSRTAERKLDRLSVGGEKWRLKSLWAQSNGGGGKGAEITIAKHSRNRRWSLGLFCIARPTSTVYPATSWAEIRLRAENWTGTWPYHRCVQSRKSKRISRKSKDKPFATVGGYLLEKKGCNEPRVE